MEKMSQVGEKSSGRLYMLLPSGATLMFQHVSIKFENLSFVRFCSCEVV